MSGRCKACNSVFLQNEGRFNEDTQQFEELCNYCLKILYGNPEDEDDEENDLCEDLANALFNPDSLTSTLKD